MLTGTNLVFTKQYNLRIVQEVIRVFGPLSRADIARRTSLTVQTVSNLVKELLSLGFVAESGRRAEGRGAPSTPLSVNPEGAFAIGLDLDRDHLTGVLVDLGGSVRQRLYLQLDEPTPEQALDLLADTAETLLRQEGLSAERVWGVGLGSPGPMEPAPGGTGYVVSPMLPGWHQIPLGLWLEERLGLPVVLENNATAAAVGERWYGAGQQIDTFFYFYFGSGLGGGLVVKGQPFEGATGNAGEIGYLPLRLSGENAPGANGEPWHAGLVFKLPRLYDRLRSDGARSVRTPEDLEQLLLDGNAALRAWIESAADHLTGLVLAVEYILDPEAIFFGGRLPEPLLEQLLERVTCLLTARRLGRKASAPQYRLATAGVNAAALGLATLPLYTYFSPTPRHLLKRVAGREVSR